MLIELTQTNDSVPKSNIQFAELKTKLNKLIKHIKTAFERVKKTCARLNGTLFRCDIKKI